jgi:hypothetical protein
VKKTNYIAEIAASGASRSEASTANNTLSSIRPPRWSTLASPTGTKPLGVAMMYGVRRAQGVCGESARGEADALWTEESS